MNYGLIGEKLGHSYSKFIQERLLDNYTYEIHPIPKEKLDAFMKKKDFKGINVTIPYKEKVLPYLDFIDEKAKRIGAVNTIVNKNNKLYGYNTDYYGFDYMIKVHNINLKDKTILILGAGGASKAIQEVCKDHNCKELIMTATRQRDNIVTIDEVYKRSDDIDIIINTTPCGMYPNIYTKACDVSKFKNCKAVIDVVYNPINTELCLEARELGIFNITGLEMLVAQAKKALEYFKDIQIDDLLIDTIYKDILFDTSNIVLHNKEHALQFSKTLHKEYMEVTEDNLNDITLLTNKLFYVEKEFYINNKKAFYYNAILK